MKRSSAGDARGAGRGGGRGGAALAASNGAAISSDAAAPASGSAVLRAMVSLATAAAGVPLALGGASAARPGSVSASALEGALAVESRRGRGGGGRRSPRVRRPGQGSRGKRATVAKATVSSACYLSNLAGSGSADPQVGNPGKLAPPFTSAAALSGVPTSSGASDVRSGLSLPGSNDSKSAAAVESICSSCSAARVAAGQQSSVGTTAATLGNGAESELVGPGPEPQNKALWHLGANAPAAQAAEIINFGRFLDRCLTTSDACREMGIKHLACHGAPVATKLPQEDIPERRQFSVSEKALREFLRLDPECSSDVFSYYLGRNFIVEYAVLRRQTGKEVRTFLVGCPGRNLVEFGRAALIDKWRTLLAASERLQRVVSGDQRATGIAFLPDFRDSTELTLLRSHLNPTMCALWDRECKGPRATHAGAADVFNVACASAAFRTLADVGSSAAFLDRYGSVRGAREFSCLLACLLADPTHYCPTYQALLRPELLNWQGAFEPADREAAVLALSRHVLVEYTPRRLRLFPQAAAVYRDRFALFAAADLGREVALEDVCESLAAGDTAQFQTLYLAPRGTDLDPQAQRPPPFELRFDRVIRVQDGGGTRATGDESVTSVASEMGAGSVYAVAYHSPDDRYGELIHSFF